MTQSRFSPKLVTGAIVTLFFGIALGLRIAIPYDQVFGGDWIKFTGVDAYYHLRLVDNLLTHFPHYITFDPYTFYPQGTVVSWPPFFDWLIAGTAWFAGLGSPTEHTVNVVGAYSPAVLGALTIVPVYFIGKELFSRWAGILSAGLIAIMPGEFLGRSILGFTDHHVAETLFAASTMLFLILAIKTARQRRLSFNHLRQRDLKVITRPFIYSLLCGLSLGIYILNWLGSPLLIFLIFTYFIVQFTIDHLRGESTDYLGITGTLSLFVAATVTLPLLPHTWARAMIEVSLLIATVTPLLLSGASRLMTSKKIKRVYYPLALIGGGLAGLVIFYTINPALVKSMLSRFSIFTPGGANLTILEMQPLLFPGGSFSLSVAWGNFTTGFFLSLIALGIVIYSLIKQARPDRTLLVVWSLIMLMATLGQRRFAYYFAINAALLTGYLSWLILEATVSKEAKARFKEAKKRLKTKVRPDNQQSGFRLPPGWAKAALGILTVVFLVFYPNIGPAIATVSQAGSTPDDAWYESLSWLQDNTPDPFGNPDFYYEIYEPPPPGKIYDYPESAYGILTWWDYGHWITRIAHRIPNRSPLVTGIPEIASFFTAQNEASSYEVIDELGSRYIIIDYSMTITKFHAMATWAGSSEEKFYEVYYQLRADKLVPVLLFYPEYYQSLAVRLYNFDGKGVTPNNSMVISYEQKMSGNGKRYKEITSIQSFTSYEAAASFVASQKANNYKIVGTNPFISPVSLKAFEHYRLIYNSGSSIAQPDGDMISTVKIFEYTG